MRPGGLVLAALFFCPLPAASAQELLERGTFKGQQGGRSALTPDGKILAAGSDDRGVDLKLWDVATGKEVAALTGQTDGLSVLVFSADGKRLAAGGHGGVQVWDVSTRKVLAALKDLGHSADVIAFNRDGARLAAAGWRQVKLWELASGRELASFRQRISLTGGEGAAFSNDLKTLAVRDHQEIDLWDTATAKVRATLSEHRGEVCCLAFSGDDRTLVAASERYEGKGYVFKGDLKLWDVMTGKERAAFPGPFGRVQGMALSPDGKLLALLDRGDLDAEADLKLVDAGTGRQRVLRVPPACSFLAPHFTADGKLLVTGVSVEALKLWEVSLPGAAGKR